MRQLKAFTPEDAIDDGYLFFDTETTGLSPSSRIVQLAWILCTPDGEEVSRGNHLIKPDGFTIPKDATAIHGISTERALKEGVPLAEAMEGFQRDLAQAAVVIGHNIGFDEAFITGESVRLGALNVMPQKKMVCTMQGTVEFCAIPSASGYSRYKWPKLAELHRRLFDKEFEGAHDAMVDVEATMRCFWELRKRGVL